MRKLITTLAFSILFCAAFSQKNINQNENMSPLSNQRPPTFEEYLVQLAITNSPEAEGGKYDIDARKQEISLAKIEWRRNLTGGFNFNDVSVPYFLVNGLGVKNWFGNPIDLTKVPQVATSPLWNVGLGLNFGDLYNRKYKIKYAQDKVKISESELEFKKQKLRGEVLKRYQEYVATFDILKVRLQALDAAESNKTQISNLFSVNKASFIDFNTANKAYFDALENKVKAESEIKIRRIALEELIGVKWETVEKVKATYEQKK